MCVSYSLEQAHLLEVGAGVGEALLCVRQVVVGAEVEAVGVQDVVDHGQERLVVLHLFVTHIHRSFFLLLHVYKSTLQGEATKNTSRPACDDLNIKLS